MINEENFIRELKKQNEDALDYLIDQYGWVIKTVLKRHLFHLIDYYDDCMNDCLLAVWEGIGSYDPTRSSFSNWLAGLARFKSIDYMRRHLKDRGWENIDDHIIPDERDPLSQLLQKELAQETQEILSGLSQRDQVIFKKLYLEGKSMDQVSLELGSSKPLLYNRISRARKALRKKQALKEEMENERFQGPIQPNK